MNMKIKILQATISTPYKFLSYRTAQRENFSLLDYSCVFDGEVDADGLDDIFAIFNSDERPNPKTMHSLSVSDLVVTTDGTFYCDNFGWKKIL